MFNFKKDLVKIVLHEEKAFKLFEREQDYGAIEIGCSCFSKDLQILVRGESNNRNPKRNALLFFVDPNTRQFKGGHFREIRLHLFHIN